MTENTEQSKGRHIDDVTTQTVNVSGRKFDISEQLWATIRKNIPEYQRPKLKRKGSDVFIERHAGTFETVLYYYQTGSLHMPADLCPSSYRDELEFWGVKPNCMAKCCFQKYVSYFDDENALKIMEEDQIAREKEKASLSNKVRRGGWKGLQAKVWLVLEEPFHSLAAKVG